MVKTIFIWCQFFSLLGDSIYTLLLTATLLMMGLLIRSMVSCQEALSLEIPPPPPSPTILFPLLNGNYDLKAPLISLNTTSSLALVLSVILADSLAFRDVYLLIHFSIITAPQGVI